MSSGTIAFSRATELKLSGFELLEKVVVGRGCFSSKSEVFEMRDCGKLESVKIGDECFVNVASVVFEGMCESGR